MISQKNLRSFDEIANTIKDKKYAISDTLFDPFS